jgi:hypothetical protein
MTMYRHNSKQQRDTLVQFDLLRNRLADSLKQTEIDAQPVVQNDTC